MTDYSDIGAILVELEHLRGQMSDLITDALGALQAIEDEMYANTYDQEFNRDEISEDIQTMSDEEIMQFEADEYENYAEEVTVNLAPANVVSTFALQPECFTTDGAYVQYRSEIKALENEHEQLLQLIASAHIKALEGKR